MLKKLIQKIRRRKFYLGFMATMMLMLSVALTVADLHLAAWIFDTPINTDWNHIFDVWLSRVGILALMTAFFEGFFTLASWCSGLDRVRQKQTS